MADKSKNTPELIEDDETLDQASGGIKMHDVIVSSYQTGGSRSDSVPVEDFSLNYEEIKVTYKR